ncbi:MAG TPA: LuxR C-terminal-related transcriptional regulator [Fimbriimonas sp.]
MVADTDNRAFRPDLLSVREREILDLAVDGCTDEMIAQSLAIATSTVNSYWVRIRSKLGQLSRTEIVSAMLRHESNLKYADLIAENERLVQSEKTAKLELSHARSDLRASTSGLWVALALNHAADAMVVCEPPGRVVFANLQSQKLFAAEPDELEGMMVWDLAIPEVRELKRATAKDVFKLDGPPRVVVGVESPFYGLRRDGDNFRGVLVASASWRPGARWR